MKAQETHPKTAELPLFEFNLIGDRVDKLRRKQLFGRLIELSAVTMLLVAMLFGMLTLMSLMTIVRTRIRLSKISNQMLDAQATCDELDALRQRAAERVGVMDKLTPVAKARVAWAPKLTALAESRIEGMGVTKVQIFSGDLFVYQKPLEEAVPEKAKLRRRQAKKVAKPPKMTFSVVYLPAAGKSEDPMGEFRENLRNSPWFMEKMGLPRLIGTVEKKWHTLPVQTFQGTIKGVIPENET